jgi:hypothetical protein
MGISNHRLPHVATRCQAVVRREGGFHRLATGGYGRRVATGDGLSELGAAGS